MWPRYGQPAIVLPPKHAELFRSILHTLSDLVGWDESENVDFASDVPVFGRLTQGQKQVVLLQAARALLDPNEPAPKLTASLAGAVGAVYRFMAEMVTLEVQVDETTEVREQVLAAIDEMGHWQKINDSLVRLF